MSIFIWSVTEYKNTKYSSLDNMSLYRYWLTQNDPHSRPKRIWEKILNVNGEGYIGTDNYDTWIEEMRCK